MKKIVALLLTFVVVLSCAACATDVRTADMKTFTYDEFSITLTKAFKETSISGYTVCYDSSKVAVFVLREPKADFASMGEININDYAELVHTANAARLPSDVTMENGKLCFEYSWFNSDEGKSYKYFSTMHESKDAFYCVQFCVDLEDYDEYKPSFLLWAKSVDFND